jgi:hypothetical protein
MEGRQRRGWPIPRDGDGWATEEGCVSGFSYASLDLSSDERALITELLVSEQARLLVEIRHTDHRTYRNELRRRLETIEGLMKRWPAAA